MRTELVSEPGDPLRPNEDFASVALPAGGQGGALVVLDGVTPPPDGYGCRHPVAWFTSRLGGTLTELSISERDVPLPDVLSQAISRTALAHAQTCDLSHPRTPQATLALARWSSTDVEYLVLSDSALLIERPDGTVTAVLDDRLSLLPRAALATAASVDSTLRNREGGFWTAAADPAVAARAVTGTVPREEVRSLVALTDGASRWVEKFREGGWSDCLTFVRKAGAHGLVHRVRELEVIDVERAFLGRGKRHDDASVVFVEL
ncbi:protein phosphatase 2C domain-containing protein [Streptomyces europaeiscabiei]|uniref:protein phosphatase 2C domain-containing protein n=1 Tax=Streptomyces europaeiscabiei TaxID=146819 RepID=UPI000E69441A|nr:protein phosphatase 2C domain-containing protein [Streptomyces europaeiscabiei]